MPWLRPKPWPSPSWWPLCLRVPSTLHPSSTTTRCTPWLVWWVWLQPSTSWSSLSTKSISRRRNNVENCPNRSKTLFSSTNEILHSVASISSTTFEDKRQSRLTFQCLALVSLLTLDMLQLHPVSRMKPGKHPWLLHIFKSTKSQILMKCHTVTLKHFSSQNCAKKVF